MSALLLWQNCAANDTADWDDSMANIYQQLKKKTARSTVQDMQGNVDDANAASFNLQVCALPAS